MFSLRNTAYLAIPTAEIIHILFYEKTLPTTTPAEVADVYEGGTPTMSACVIPVMQTAHGVLFKAFGGNSRKPLRKHSHGNGALNKKATVC